MESVGCVCISLCVDVDDSDASGIFLFVLTIARPRSFTIDYMHGASQCVCM
jgi:hypothetical protein